MSEVEGGNESPFDTATDALTYEPFFGLNEKPFSLDADPRFLFASPTHDLARKNLLAGIRRREGLLVLTGEIGTGKTTLCRAVLSELGPKTYCSFVPDPFAEREDLLKMLLVDFGVVSIPELNAHRLQRSSRTELAYKVSEFLNSLRRDAYAVVIIDEAQNLSLPLIEETRILFDTFGAKGRLQIVFVGQPELHAKLKLPEMRQVDQRVCGYHRLAPMSVDAVEGYVRHRLQVAGLSAERELFPRVVVEVLHRRTGGVPRLINRVCDRALHLAFERNAESVDQEILDTALIEVGSITLSPTWDSIIFAEPSAPAPPAVEPSPAPSMPVRPVAHVVEDDFKKQVNDWVDQELAPSSRTPSTPVKAALDREQPTPASSPVPKRPVPPRRVRTEWSRDIRSETYLQRVWRMTAKRAAIAVAAVACLGVAWVGASLAIDAQTAPVGPALPAAVAQTPTAPTPVDASPLPADGLVQATAVDYLVAVGLFDRADQADQVVDALTEAGLPAMQRPLQLDQKEMQQIVLGPFFSREDAMADLRRLQSLGGYQDANIVAADSSEQ